MSTDFRDALQELHTSIQLYTGLNPAAADVHPAELTRRLMDAMAASAAALAQPEPEPPTAWMYQGEPDFDGNHWRENWKTTLDEKLARYMSGKKEPIPLWCRPTIQPEPVAPTDEALYELWNSEGIEADFQDCCRFARAYAARYARPTIEPVPQQEAV
jgi:hypothetical protein